MNDGATPLHIDARGLRCPWPALRLARALRSGAQSVDILADDPAAEREIGALASAHGLTVQHVEIDGVDGFRIG
ncbi:sulfurtransferase TusA family protein [Sphingomonas sp. R647]|uniref:sulfurtransferase TusA family protein n=1 Tax=Sphingomonas sp. R647 TaxID=2875233 RepID=UPI001CD6874E|nr:sulfurtransferase TusA family protein [Sphingomonas sp. R647]MCA1196587.1 sulfurtransferase TusA family protein [Sphingomonas sp. R647]